MTALNYKHLHYFWMVAKAGSIARAARLLHLTPHSISAQIGTFEESLGVALFQRTGRRLEISEAGQRILAHADEIFALGDQIVDILRDRNTNTAAPFRIGITDSVPKSVVHELIKPALEIDAPGRLICREGLLAPLLAELAVHRLDMVIADRPIPPGLSVRGYSHLLGESALSIFTSVNSPVTPGASFPNLLDRAPFLLPGEDVSFRAALLHWFDENRIRPRIVAEFDDSALMKAFGQAGAGMFAAPSAIETYLCAQYQVRSVGRIDSIRAQIYALTTERKLTHPVMRAISNRAREALT